MQMLETDQARMLSGEEFHTLLYTALLAGEQYRTAQANFGLRGRCCAVALLDH
jgi:hypothetical protein